MSIRPPRSGAIVNFSPGASRSSRVGFAVVAGMVGALLIVASVAFGHAELATVTPADKSIVEGPPEEVVMTFTQNLDPLKSSIRVVDAAGNLVVLGGIVASRSPREMYVALPGPLPGGAYEIRWTTFSTEDQELDHGTTTFTVAAAPSVAPSASAVAPSASSSVSSSAAPSVAVSAMPSSTPTTPATSTSDAVIPVVVALIVLAGLGTWLLRSRARAR